MNKTYLAEFLKEQPEALDELISALEFYGSGEFYTWEGCHCHGSYEFEKGDRAEQALYTFENKLDCFSDDMEENESGN